MDSDAEEFCNWSGIYSNFPMCWILKAKSFQIFSNPVSWQTFSLGYPLCSPAYNNSRSSELPPVHLHSSNHSFTAHAYLHAHTYTHVYTQTHTHASMEALDKVYLFFTSSLHLRFAVRQFRSWLPRATRTCQHGSQQHQMGMRKCGCYEPSHFTALSLGAIDGDEKPLETAVLHLSKPLAAHRMSQMPWSRQLFSSFPFLHESWSATRVLRTTRNSTGC